MFKHLLLRLYRRVFKVSHWMTVHFTSIGHIALVLLLMSAVFGVDTKASSTSQLFVFLLMIFIAALFSSLFNRFQASIKRNLPQYATVGEPLIYSVSLINQTKKNYHDLVYIEQLKEALPSYSELQAFYKAKRFISFRQWRRYIIYQRGGYMNEYPLSFIAAKQSANLKVSFTPIRRGKIVFTGAYLAKPDLLGLFRRLYFAQQAQSCLVLPKRYTIAPLQLTGKRQYQSGGVTLANSVGNSSEFMALRDYRQGDAMNQIHWKSFARHGKLIVKEYQDEYFVRRALVLDTDADNLGVELFEAAVSVAASLVMSERDNEALLDLMFVGNEAYRFTSGRGIDQMRHLQEILASVQASDAESFTRLAQAVNAHSEQCSSLVCVLLHWDKQRQDFCKALATQGIAFAVFLIHDGSLIEAELINKPENCYLINSHQIAEDLAAV